MKQTIFASSGVDKRTLFVDRWMRLFIKSGGALIILCVLGIFIFIVSQIIPIFQPARIQSQTKVAISEGGEIIGLGADEWAELPFVVDENGAFYFFDTTGRREPIKETPLLNLNNKKPTAFYYRQSSQEIAFGFRDSSVRIGQVSYTTSFEDGRRQVEETLELGDALLLGEKKGSVVSLQLGGEEESKTIVAVLEREDHRFLLGMVMKRQFSFWESGEWAIERRFDLTDQIQGIPCLLLLGSAGERCLVADERGQVSFFRIRDNEVTLVQTFEPFTEGKSREIKAMEFLYGDASTVFVNAEGETVGFSIYLHGDLDNERLLGKTKQFDAFSAQPVVYASSLRNKAFLLAGGESMSLRYGTTGETLLERKLPFTVRHALIGGKYNRLVFVDTEKKLHLYDLEDPHPESGWRSFFGKIWYEGGSEPEYVWQSSSASDEFEAKLSMIPLIWGSLKGAFFALLFAVPLALLASLYTSQFLHDDIRAIVKPVMEIMASIPSVVLGFLGALYIAPLIEGKIPSIILIFLMVPLLTFVLGRGWASLPYSIRRFVKPGYEFFYYLPVLGAIIFASWELGPVLEHLFFTVSLPETGENVANFRLWWSSHLGFLFEQRNSLIIAFAMGLAVFPLIFTLAEDALSNVPWALRSGALALGATPWQTAIRVVLPAALGGIFSAVMIGFGRAVGETMIVVMATGNTPIMDFNIFTGMRTLSANIAVELPEAPHGGTLYRSLYLGAFLLFVITILVNTIAEILRQRIRRQYRNIGL